MMMKKQSSLQSSPFRVTWKQLETEKMNSGKEASKEPFWKGWARQTAKDRVHKWEWTGQKRKGPLDAWYGRANNEHT